MNRHLLIASLVLSLTATAHAQSTNANCPPGNVSGDPASTSDGALPLSLDASAPPPPPPGGPGGRGGHGGGHGPQLTAEEKTQLQSMTEEQRRAFFEAKRQAFLASLTPEERAKIEARDAERKARWDAMTPEQKAAMQAKMKQHGPGGPRGRGGPGGHRRGPPPASTSSQAQ